MEKMYWKGTGNNQESYEELKKALHQPDAETMFKDEWFLFNALARFYYRRHNDGDKTCQYAPTFNKMARKLERKLGFYHFVLTKFTTDEQLEMVMDATIIFLHTRLVRKQVTIVMEVAITLDVPKSTDIKHLDEVICNSAVMDITLVEPTIDCGEVEVSDILEITSITEAHLD